MYVCVYVYIYIYICTHTYTYTHIHIYTRGPAEVRRAFYKKALLMHPDKGGDKAAFQDPRLEVRGNHLSNYLSNAGVLQQRRTFWQIMVILDTINSAYNK